MVNNHLFNDTLSTFKKNLRNPTGITLTELLVASFLIGIVSVGVISINVAIGRFQDSSQQTAVLRTATTAAMIFITKDALATVGDSLNRGVYAYQDAANQQICFQHDVSDLSSYADDTWSCFVHDSANEIRRCPDGTGQPAPFTGWGISIQNSCASMMIVSNSVFFTVVNDSNGNLKYITVDLTSRSDISKPADPISNPEFKLSTQISPPGHVQ